MPCCDTTTPLINKYFTGNIEISYDYVTVLNNFFYSLGFTNPRHLKKVFNKFELLKRYKKYNTTFDFPEIDNNKNIVLIIFTLYLIILHDFYSEKYNEIYKVSEKLNNYTLNFRNQAKVDRKDITLSVSESMGMTECSKMILDSYLNVEVSELTFNSLSTNTSTNDLKNEIILIIHIFLPKDVKQYHYHILKNSISINDNINYLQKYINQF